MPSSSMASLALQVQREEEERGMGWRLGGRDGGRERGGMGGGKGRGGGKGKQTQEGGVGRFRLAARLCLQAASPT